MPFLHHDLFIWGVALAALVMIRELWLSERARRSVERARIKQFTSERDFARARQRERGD